MRIRFFNRIQLSFFTYSLTRVVKSYCFVIGSHLFLVLKVGV